jgi:hypothetical protein
MMSQMKPIYHLLSALLLGLGLGLLSSAGYLSAQQGATRPTRVPVTIALVDHPSADGAPFRILRRADQAPYDIILLRPGANQSELSDAIGDLLLIRAQTGDTARTGGTMRIRRTQGASGSVRREIPWAGRVLNDLRKAQPHDLVGVGVVPTVEIWLPPQRRHATQP